MPVSTVDDGNLTWDPRDMANFADPHPTFRRLRQQAPLYHNEEHDFTALKSRRAR